MPPRPNIPDRIIINFEEKYYLSLLKYYSRLVYYGEAFFTLKTSFLRFYKVY